jgi:hypothetical protein
MPTAAKIVAAICFALFGAVAAEMVKPALPEGTQFGLFVPISAIIGLLNGWLVMGVLAGHGYRDAMGSGVRTAITIVVWALLVFSIYEMILRSMHVNRYDGPMEAVTAAFGLMLDYGKLLLTPAILGAFLVGGLIAGAITEWAKKRWN